MFFFGRKFFRSSGSYLVIVLLLLIVWLLILDQPERKPFLQRSSRYVLEIVETGCEKLKDVVSSDEEETTNEFTDNYQEEPKSNRSTTKINVPVGLPRDFFQELEEEVRYSKDSDAKINLNQICGKITRQERKIKAVTLAHSLSKRWWNVNGNLIHQEDLSSALK